jgi:hypothetical protein
MGETKVAEALRDSRSRRHYICRAVVSLFGAPLKAELHGRPATRAKERQLLRARPRRGATGSAGAKETKIRRSERRPRRQRWLKRPSGIV